MLRRSTLGLSPRDCLCDTSLPARGQLRVTKAATSQFITGRTSFRHVELAVGPGASLVRVPVWRHIRGGRTSNPRGRRRDLRRTRAGQRSIDGDERRWFSPWRPRR
ncbi:protein of unknown function [Micropruina glycogenica]|uniref:Uncharacterized protein n=1 Tax=Micropruina glycogenica TaxID=75385 RepID=A0A2N9JDZ2_9ACTN|nr:protein of unknown function [Micropruina glycogenica]